MLGAALLLLPEHFLSRRRTKLDVPARLLFVNHAKIIRDQMADDLEHGVDPVFPRMAGRITRGWPTKSRKHAAVRVILQII